MKILHRLSKLLTFTILLTFLIPITAFGQEPDPITDNSAGCRPSIVTQGLNYDNGHYEIHLNNCFVYYLNQIAEAAEPWVGAAATGLCGAIGIIHTATGGVCGGYGGLLYLIYKSGLWLVNINNHWCGNRGIMVGLKPDGFITLRGAC